MQTTLLPSCVFPRIAISGEKLEMLMSCGLEGGEPVRKRIPVATVSACHKYHWYCLKYSFLSISLITEPLLESTLGFFILLMALSNKLHFVCLCFHVLFQECSLTLYPTNGGLRGTSFHLLALEQPKIALTTDTLYMTASCFSNGQLTTSLPTLTFHPLCSTTWLQVDL